VKKIPNVHKRGVTFNCRPARVSLHSRKNPSFMRIVASLLVGSAAVTSTIAVSPVPNQVGSHQLQCDVYALAAKFGLKIQPSMSSLQKQMLADALTLPNCTSTSSSLPTPATILGAQSAGDTPRQLHNNKVSPVVSVQQNDGNEIFVDAVHGSDTGSGSLTDPLQTLPAALAKSRQLPASSAKTITLRSGTYYLANTLELTDVDSYLTIQGYAGEVAEVSGSSPVNSTSLKWEEYNVNATGGATMISLPNTNCVERATFGENNTYVNYMGKTDDAATCSDMCLHDSQCDAFTWHDPNQPSGSQQWDNMYVGISKALHCSSTACVDC